MDKFFKCKLVPLNGITMSQPGAAKDASSRIIYFNPVTGMVLESQPLNPLLRGYSLASAGTAHLSFTAEFDPSKTYTFTEVQGAHKARIDAFVKEKRKSDGKYEIQKDIYEEPVKSGSHVSNKRSA